MSFVLTKGTDDEDDNEFAYVPCAYACVASEYQALGLGTLTSMDGSPKGSQLFFSEQSLDNVPWKRLNPTQIQLQHKLPICNMKLQSSRDLIVTFWTR